MSKLFDTTIKNGMHYCNGCKGPLFTDIKEMGLHKTYKSYAKGKYSYCPKCGYQIAKRGGKTSWK